MITYIFFYPSQTLYDIAVHPDAYGEPYLWTSHEVAQLDGLLKCWYIRTSIAVGIGSK